MSAWRHCLNMLLPLRRRAASMALLIGFVSLSICARGEFALKDGDTVVFLGDSITAEGTYGKIVENYTLLRFPGRKIRFINSGKGGDTASSAVLRLERDVFAHKATVVTVAYGVNDIGWGMKANDAHKQLYLDGIRTIVTECRKRGVRVFICSAAITGADPFKSENDFLQKMCDEGMALSRSLGEHSIDLQRTMREINRKVWKANEGTTNPREKSSLHTEDTIHLNETGQIAMAYAMLKGLGAPEIVSACRINGADGQVTEATGCRISDVTRESNRLEFTRHDDGLPLNLGLIGLLSRRFVPLDELGKYMLAIDGLKAGTYLVKSEGRTVGKYSSEQLAAGVDIGSATPDAWEPGGPWAVQAAMLRPVTDARFQLQLSHRNAVYYLGPTDRQKEVSAQIWKRAADLEPTQRDLARSRPCEFTVELDKGENATER